MNFVSKTSDHLFIQALHKGRHWGAESTRRLLPALGEQKQGEAGMQIRAQVTLREFKQLRVCICIYICPLYIYIRSCLYLYTEGTKQPSEINSHCEGLRKKEQEKAFQRKCFQNRSSSGPERICLKREILAPDRMKKRNCELKVCLL